MLLLTQSPNNFNIIKNLEILGVTFLVRPVYKICQVCIIYNCFIYMHQTSQGNMACKNSE